MSESTEPAERMAAALERIATALETLAGLSGDPQQIVMRQTCDKCGSERGYIVTKRGQNTVRCANCDAFVYNQRRSSKQSSAEL